MSFDQETSEPSAATGGARLTLSEQVPGDQHALALEEFKALKSDQQSALQAQAGLVGIALTATAAIAGFAFDPKTDDPRFQILLALPLVLSGLGLSFVAQNFRAVRSAFYIKVELWPFLQAGRVPDHGAVVSRQNMAPSVERRTPIGLSSVVYTLPAIVIFGGPAIAALVINRGLAGGGRGSELQAAWWSDLTLLLVTAAVAVLAWAVARHADPKAWARARENEWTMRGAVTVSDEAEGHGSSSKPI